MNRIVLIGNGFDIDTLGINKVLSTNQVLLPALSYLISLPSLKSWTAFPHQIE